MNLICKHCGQPVESWDSLAFGLPGGLWFAHIECLIKERKKNESGND